MALPKITYWANMVSTINRAFQRNVLVDPKPCVLGLLDDVVQDVYMREATTRALFQACKLILAHWISKTIPTVQMWVDQMDITLRYGKLISQYRGNSSKFEKVRGKLAEHPWFGPSRLSFRQALAVRLFLSITCIVKIYSLLA